MNKKFDYNGNTFEIREAVINNHYAVRVFLGNQQVSPEYSASLEVGQDFFATHKEHILGELSKMAERDIRDEIYIKA